jgi:uncharacterized repeat protein (TIGR01451 family)
MQRTMLKKGNASSKGVVSFSMRSILLAPLSTCFRLGDWDMRSLRTKNRFAAAALTFLLLINGGCNASRTGAIRPMGEWGCVRPFAQSTLTGMCCDDQCLAADRQVGYGAVETSTAMPELKGPQTRDVIVADSSQPKADSAPDMVAAQSGLKIDVIDLSDPVPKGTELTIKIIVSNAGTLSERNVSVVATIPSGMSPVEADPSEPGRRTITGQTVRFDPVAEIRPGERREYRMTVLTQRAGQFAVRAELTGGNLRQPLGAESTTEVMP